MKKFKLTEEQKTLENGVVVYRIEALIDFGSVKKREKGGWVEKETNLFQFGDCWVRENAVVRGNAEVKMFTDYFFCINNISSGSGITYTRSNGKWTTGCFFGTGDELIKKAYADSEEKGKWFERLVNFVENK